MKILTSDKINDIFPTAVGMVEKQPVEERARRSNIDEFILLYVTGGKGAFSINDKHMFELYPGDIAICPPNALHDYGSKEEPMSHYYIHFSGERAQFYREELKITDDQPIASIGLRLEIESLFKEMIDLSTSAASFKNLLMMSTCLHYIFGKLIDCCEPTGKNREAGNIQIIKSLEYIHNNYNKKMSVNEMSKVASMSHSHFSREFKKETGFSPAEYLNRLKIQNACTMLEKTPKSIFEISEELGFNDQFHFSKLFKSIAGMPPSRYRKVNLSYAMVD